MTENERDKISNALKGAIENLDVLEDFKCQMNFFGNEQHDKCFTAYSMDGEAEVSGAQCPDMRHDAAKIGPCSCCDYMQIRGDAIALIEVTDIARKAREFINDCKGMSPEPTDKYVEEMMKVEIVQKVYGGLLVLCRMGFYKKLQSKLADKEIVFMLVHNGGNDPQGSDFILNQILEKKVKGGVGGLSYNKTGTKIRVCVVSTDRAKDLLQCA